MKTYLGIDWGGTFLKAGIIGGKGELIRKEIISSTQLKKKEVFLERIKELLETFKNHSIAGLGIGVPGIVNVKKGFIYYLPNIDGWKNYPLKKTLERILGLPVFLENDANVFALAEARLGAARDKSRVIFLTLGTGLGGGIILDGKILRGKNSACELGHIPIVLDGKKCSCGSKGCIETFVGAKYLLEKYKKLKKKEAGEPEVHDIFKRALEGEKQALIIWEEFSQSLGKFLAGMVNLFNPEVIVFGGGVSGAFKLFKPLVWSVIKQHTMWPYLKNLKLVRAKLKNAGIIGAALLAKDADNRKSNADSRR